jgi:tetratricopeptide (TPR) repeat protein
LKRQSRNQLAIESYHEALLRDPRAVRAHVDLCQLYSAIGDYPQAEQHAQSAMKRFMTLQNRGGQAQAMLCDGDQLLQQAVRLKEARQYIEGARDIFASLNYAYGLSRVYQYLGFLAGQERDYPAAVRSFKEALTRSQQIGNRQIEGLVLMNLGVVYSRMGDPAAAATYYERTRDVYQAIGDERRAAEQEVNAAALQVDYANDEAVVRGLENARATFRKLGHVDFEVFAMRVMAESRLASGRLDDALRLVREAASVGTERQLKDRVTSLKVTEAKIDLLKGEYEAARQTLEELANAAGATAESRIALGRVYLALGDFKNAEKYLLEGLAEGQERSESMLVHLAQASLGEVAYESGDLNAARARFQQVAATNHRPLPDPATITATCRLSTLDAKRRAQSRWEQASVAGITWASKAGQRLVETRCRLDLAAIQVQERRYAAALAALQPVVTGKQVNVGVEMEALTHYWRGRALAGSGDQKGGDQEKLQALAAITRIRDSLPDRYRGSFSARASLRALFE